MYVSFISKNIFDEQWIWLAKNIVDYNLIHRAPIGQCMVSGQNSPWKSVCPKSNFVTSPWEKNVYISWIQVTKTSCHYQTYSIFCINLVEIGYFHNFSIELYIFLGYFIRDSIERDVEQLFPFIHTSRRASWTIYLNIKVVQKPARYYLIEKEHVVFP